MKNKRGSLTVEATLAATVFICIVVALLTVVKLVLVEYVLTYSANESAKAIADVSYLVNMINDIQEDMDDELGASTFEKATSFGKFKSNTASSVLQSYISFGLSDKDKKATAKLNGGLKKTGIKTLFSLGKQVGTGVYAFFRDEITEFKNNMKQEFVADLISLTIDEKGIPFNKDKLTIEIVKFPETSREYTMNSVNVNYIKNGLYAGTHFDKDDAVVVLSYKADLNFPFLGKREFTLRKIAIEKCWINGDNGIITKFKGKGLLERGIESAITILADYATSNDVYIINNSSKYHSSRICGKIGDKHVTKLKEYVAKGNGYSACSSCG